MRSMLYEASAEVVVRASAREFLAVVWDFARYGEFITGINGTEVMPLKPQESESERVLVRVDAGIFGLGFSYVLDCRRDGDRRVWWKRTSGSFNDAFGSWTIVEENAEGVRARYDNAVDPGFPVPAFAVRFILDRQLPKLLDEMKTRVESRAGRAS